MAPRISRSLASFVMVCGVIPAGCDSGPVPEPTPQQQAKVDAYVGAAQRWYDERLVELEGYVAGFQASDRFRELTDDWKKELEKHRRDGVQPMSFGSTRDLVRDGTIVIDNWTFEVGRIGYVEFGRIIEVIDDHTALISVQDDPPKPRQRVIIKGIDVSGNAAGEVIHPPVMMEVVGTTTHPTARGGDKTVFLLEPFDLRPYRSGMPAATVKD